MSQPAGSAARLERDARARPRAPAADGPSAAGPQPRGATGPPGLAAGRTPRVELAGEEQAQRVTQMLDEFDAGFIGLAPVKARVREIAALLLVDRLRQRYGLSSSRPSLHMCFTGSPGTGKTTVAMRMGALLHALGYLRRGQLVSVTRDDLVGQYVGHTAPKTKEVLKRAMGGVLLIDEAYYLYRPENERDYGQEAIEILLQFMEANREDLVVILAGYADRMDMFFRSNPGLASRVAHHIDFPDFTLAELIQIAGLMLDREQYRLTPDGRGGVPRVCRAAHAAAPVRQRAQHPQRHRPDAAAPGPPPGRGGRPDRPGRPDADQRRRRAGQPGVQHRPGGLGVRRRLVEHGQQQPADQGHVLVELDPLLVTFRRVLDRPVRVPGQRGRHQRGGQHRGGQPRRPPSASMVPAAT